jgi:hypothetical protein
MLLTVRLFICCARACMNLISPALYPRGEKYDICARVNSRNVSIHVADGVYDYYYMTVLCICFITKVMEYKVCKHDRILK